MATISELILLPCGCLAPAQLCWSAADNSAYCEECGTCYKLDQIQIGQRTITANVWAPSHPLALGIIK